ncbi:MAG: UvrD-helicase domain-containing protein, partial [Cyclobacteriaceae bacterium]|nr:UvrD-helicase domain-containing protein [Cyclobacteriaceae bacterium]
MNSTPKETFSIYRSSAGSGKTYQLAIEFVAMAINNPNLFNKILAVTFTNKATKEMKERILSFLLLLANKDDAELLNQVKGKTRLSNEEICANAKIVIGKILHQYSQFSISTIDAFFQKIVKSFAKELGLLGNYKVEPDQDKIKLEIIEQIGDELGEDKELTNWLVDFSFTKVDENRSWNIRPQIESLANEVFKESFRPIEKDLQKIDRKKFKSFLEQVRKIKIEFEKAMKIKAREAIDLMESHGLSVDDFSYKSGGPAGYFNRIITKKEFDPKSRVAAAIDDPEKWYAKSSPKKVEIQQVVEGGLQELTQAIVDHYNEHIQEYTTANEVLKNFYVFGILSQIIKKLKDYRQENDVMLISDVPVFLTEIIANNDAPFIYEKTGTWFQHYLIDEFQDTSGFQWQNFKPLVENGLSQEFKSLLVGDGKQSIYRWRGGDWNLILHQVKEDLRMYNPADKHLNTNWRSARKIIEFNNEVF